MQKIINAAAALALLVPVLGIKVSYDFYTVMRFIVTAAALYNAYSLYRRKAEFPALLWAGTAALFNPIMVVHLSRSAWKVIDLAVIIFIIYTILAAAEKEPPPEPPASATPPKPANNGFVVITNGDVTHETIITIDEKNRIPVYNSDKYHAFIKLDTLDVSKLDDDKVGALVFIEAGSGVVSLLVTFDFAQQTYSVGSKYTYTKLSATQYSLKNRNFDYRENDRVKNHIVMAQAAEILQDIIAEVFAKGKD